MSDSPTTERLPEMNTSLIRSRNARGSATPIIIVVIVLLAAAAAGAWWYMNRGAGTATTATPAATTAPATATSAEPLPTVSPAVEELSIDQLYREARSAMAEQRMVMPAGNNALEYYLAILQKDATNAGAMDALRELFPFASGTAEQQIDQGNLEEATRIIDSLAKADSSNYTLTILRSKIEAKRKSIDQQAAAEAAAAAAAAVPKPPVDTALAPSTVTPVTASETTPSPTATADTAPTQPVASQPEPTPAAAAAPQGISRDVEIVTPVAPTYPSQAARNRDEGWVEVEFTVTAEGAVVGAKVVASDPPRTFDREAVRSIERTKFNPRMENGVAVTATVRRRIEFKLGN
jgi:protein TonB